MRQPSSKLILGAGVLWAAVAAAQPPVERSFTQLPSSNGHTALLVDLPSARLTHFRERLFATEEPFLDGTGVIHTRDLLYDAYFGLRSGGTQRWLTSVPVALEESGYLGHAPGKAGGTGIVHWKQAVDGLEVSAFAFAPRDFPRAALVMVMRVRNPGPSAVPAPSAFTLHNFHLGFGRPGVMADLGESGETVELDGPDISERGFAGVVVTRALATPARVSAWHLGSAAAQNGYLTVAGGGQAELPLATQTPTADGWAHAFQFDLPPLGPGEEAWAGVVAAHHGDPFAGAQLRAQLEGWVGQRGPEALLTAERASWAAFQDRVKVPQGSSAQEEALVRQSAVMLAMAQVQEGEAYLREWLTVDGEPRDTRFPVVGGGALPGTVTHRGKGAVLASLPPGEWTYAWARDGAYAVAAMAQLGLWQEARDALAFYLQADAGLFRHWNELAPYGMPPYQITLTRYHGFGVEETDFNDFGPNLEFDGFGLILWALGRYEAATGDTSLADEAWELLATRVADPLLALVNPATGLIYPDSSIWETHWNGRQRTWTYTSLTAARGLCDAAAIAGRRGESARADGYRAAGMALRAAIAERLTDPAGALASNLEELQAGRGHDDAAVLDALAMGLFSPGGRIAQGTLDAVDARLRVAAGPGWARNDDRTDHAGAEDLSPWGSDYDSAEWVITDLRGAIALRMAGRTARADELLDWVQRQSAANFLAVAETYDEQTGRYKFNAPMIGFGAGAHALALAHRADGTSDPACGAYHPEPPPPPANPDAGTPAGPDAGTDPAPPPPSGCGCAAGPGAGAFPLAGLALLWLARRRLTRRAATGG